MKISKHILFLSICLTLSCAHSINREKIAGESDHSIQVAGTERTYVVYSPGTIASKVPLMIVVHGGTGNGHHSSRTMGMNAVADKNNFIVAYPDGTSTLLGKDRRVWNAGNCCAVAQKKNIDDVRFFNEMIKKIIKEYPIDPKRIYITGESNGAMLTYRLVCELPDVFAAAIPISGSLLIDNCKAGNNVAFFDVHGSDDKNVPYEGGKGRGLSDATFRSIPESIKIITTMRQCAEPVKTVLPNGDIDVTYTCKAGATVRTRLIKGGGHPWPINAGSEKNSTFFRTR